jgi:hypothetical protein
MSTDTQAPINPLTGDLTTVTVSDTRTGTGKAQVQGRLVAPGLALTPERKSNPKHPDRYAVTHIPTGLAVIPGACGVHALENGEAAAAVGIDWTITDQKAMVDAIRTAGVMQQLMAHWHTCNGRWCTVGDGPEPKSWSFRCLTCRSEWDEYQDDDWPLSYEEARAEAEAHSCEPEMELQSAETGEWGHPWTFETREPITGIEAVRA